MPFIATAWHAALRDINSNVRVRIERGCAVSEADYADMMRERTRLVRAMDARLSALDALLMPTTSIVAPTIAEIADKKIFAARDAALLRNTSIINFSIFAPFRCRCRPRRKIAGRAHADRAQRPGSPAACASLRRQCSFLARN